MNNLNNFVQNLMLCKQSKKKKKKSMTAKANVLQFEIKGFLRCYRKECLFLTNDNKFTIIIY